VVSINDPDCITTRVKSYLHDTSRDERFSWPSDVCIFGTPTRLALLFRLRLLAVLRSLACYRRRSGRWITDLAEGNPSGEDVLLDVDDGHPFATFETRSSREGPVTLEDV
jgi:hypothetical protein